MKSFVFKSLALVIVFIFFFSPLLPLLGDTKAESGKVNINTASLDELQKLPRIGPQVAQRIIDYRKEHGNFKKVEDLMKVRGIGEKTFSRFKDQITVGTEAQPK